MADQIKPNQTKPFSKLSQQASKASGKWSRQSGDDEDAM
jgi:hypothetical protein